MEALLGMLLGVLTPDIEERIRTIRRKRWSGFNVEDEIAFVGGSDTGYDWISQRGVVEDSTGVYEICMPNPFGSFFIRTLRPFGERIWNGGYVRREPITGSIARETKTMERVLEAGFPVQRPRPDKAKEWGLRTSLVREHGEGTPLATRYSRLSVEAHETLARESGAMLARLHETTPWGDAWPGNIIVSGEMFFPDRFALKPDLSLPVAQQFAKDIIQLYFTTMYRTPVSASALSTALLDGYNPEKDVKRALHRECDHWLSRSRLYSAALPFSSWVYGQPNPEKLHTYAALMQQFIE